MSLTAFIKNNDVLRRFAMALASSERSKRPRWWVRNLVTPLQMKKGKNTRISRHARLDILPNHQFAIGENSVIEDFCILNNGLGDLALGSNVFIGAFNTLIGPIRIADHVMTAQHVVFSGMDHGIADGEQPFRYQSCTTAEISVGEGSWIGANSVVLSGVTIGRMSVIAAGSVVTRDVPDHTMVAGNPAVVIKQFNLQQKIWVKANL
jgi:acetyltransferase-like isoleucine patch superfamily enzyme